MKYGLTINVPAPVEEKTLHSVSNSKIPSEITSDIQIELTESTSIHTTVTEDSTITIKSTSDIAKHSITITALANVKVKLLVQNKVSFIDCKGIIKANGKIEWEQTIIPDSYAKCHTINQLEGGEAITKVYYLGKEKSVIDIYTESNHIAAHTKSNIVTQGVVTDFSHALSRGLVHIAKQAFQSQGYEQQDALILSENARASAIPNLEIHNHDVKCSHGSTIGNINEEELFYMMSRGLPKEIAEKEIVKTYFPKDSLIRGIL